MIYAAGANLGAGKDGLVGTIGYRVIDLDGTVRVAFTTSGVTETEVPGGYQVSGGVSVPAAWSGRIEWGTATEKYAEEWVTLLSDSVAAGVSAPAGGCL